ncbi:uncharacterized protein CEXT_87781 [Caerostris extrusa]|uniref:Secreted protein n=1 Tax=Caerostris extrusa TaxID=172846 RepID=A0AAV4R037_CAEEX|nr:uncharacterized protein CEXT_87781 [Caerostris extrusa]
MVPGLPCLSWVKCSPVIFRLGVCRAVSRTTTEPPNASSGGGMGWTCGMSITSTKRFPLQLRTSLVFFGARKQIFSLNRCVRNREYSSSVCTLEGFPKDGFLKAPKAYTIGH